MRGRCWWQRRLLPQQEAFFETSPMFVHRPDAEIEREARAAAGPRRWISCRKAWTFHERGLEQSRYIGFGRAWLTGFSNFSRAAAWRGRGLGPAGIASLPTTSIRARRLPTPRTTARAASLPLAMSRRFRRSAAITTPISPGRPFRARIFRSPETARGLAAREAAASGGSGSSSPRCTPSAAIRKSSPSRTSWASLPRITAPTFFRSCALARASAMRLAPTLSTRNRSCRNPGRGFSSWLCARDWPTAAGRALPSARRAGKTLRALPGRHQAYLAALVRSRRRPESGKRSPTSLSPSLPAWIGTRPKRPKGLSAS